MKLFRSASFLLMVSIALGFALGASLPPYTVYALMLSGIGVKEYGLYFELFTAIFVTPSLADFLFNEVAMAWLYSWYRSEAGYKEVIVFLGSGVLGNLASLYFLPPNVLTSGASGGIMGVFAYYLTRDAFLRGAKIKDLVYVFFFVGYVIVFSAVLFQNVNNFAHLFGALGGVIAGVAEYSLKGRGDRAE